MAKKIQQKYLYLGLAAIAVIVAVFLMSSGGRTGQFSGSTAGYCATCQTGYVLDNGNCVAITGCTDSDGGSNTNTFGSCTDPAGTYSDSCTTSGYLNEYSCTTSLGNCMSSSTPCNPGEICSGGKCITNLNCTDTDGGYVVNTKGICTDNKGSISDSCVSNARINEQFCNPLAGNCTSWASDCPTGTTCSNGACVALPPAPACSDTDGGQDSLTFGTCTSSINGTIADSCVNYGSNWQYDVESYCMADGQCGSKYINCVDTGKVCYNGACVALPPAPACSDTDGGNVTNVKGTCTDASGSKTDSCLSNAYISEYACSYNATKGAISCDGYGIRCNSTSTCQNGACV